MRPVQKDEPDVITGGRVLRENPTHDEQRMGILFRPKIGTQNDRSHRHMSTFSAILNPIFARRR